MLRSWNGCGHPSLRRCSAGLSIYLESAVKFIRSSSSLDLSTTQKDQIRLYVDTLLRWNQKMNLTAAREANEVMKRHVDDSLSILSPMQSSYVSNCGSSMDNLGIVDVGSGPGLPGVILAIACPEWRVTLLESMNKRCIFLKHVLSVLGLPNVRVVQERAEKLGRNSNFREVFDIAVARAVAEMRILVEYCLPLVRVGGLFVAAKGHNPEDEIKNAEQAIKQMGAFVLQKSLVESYGPKGQRTAIICLKDKPTPKRYPRDPGTPSMYPL